MSKNLVIGIIVGLVVLFGGVGTYFVLNSSDSTNDSLVDSSVNDSQPTFNVASTLGESFTATMTGTTDEKTYSATIEYDGMGNGHYIGQFDENTYDLYILGDRNIICNDNQCIETPNASDASPIDSTMFEFSEEDLDSYRDGALYKGTESCPAGTCEVWEISINEYSGKLYVTEDGRISKATGSAAGGSFEIVYTYEEVTITPPENVQTIPTI